MSLPKQKRKRNFDPVLVINKRVMLLSGQSKKTKKNSRAHNVRKVRVVKYIVVYGQIKAADQKYCHNQKWRRKRKEISFRTRGFGDNLDDFWPRYCRAKVLDLSRVVGAYL